MCLRTREHFEWSESRHICTSRWASRAYGELAQATARAQVNYFRLNGTNAHLEESIISTLLHYRLCKLPPNVLTGYIKGHAGPTVEHLVCLLDCKFKPLRICHAACANGWWRFYFLSHYRPAVNFQNFDRSSSWCYSRKRLQD